MLNWINSGREHYFDVGFRFEQRIPFAGIFIFGYMLVYPSILWLYFLLKDEERFKDAIRMFLALTTLHYVFFIMLPVKMVLRPSIPNHGGVIDELIKLYYTIDMPYNCFPSLHVAYTFLSLLVLWGYKRSWGRVYLAIVIIVSASVIFIKQHYIADVLSGYATAAFVWWLVGRSQSRTRIYLFRDRV